ncbi:MAG TPA: hypothetical protein VLJ58_21295 [Ramlibacter sp.]|nr:hypothetical protein [Ramlibacter sp.]
MSAQIASTNSFSAHLALAAGVAVSITAETMEQLAGVVSKLQGAAANDAKVVVKETKPETVIKGATTSEAKDAGNASASTGTQASAPPAASGSEPDADAPRYTYDDVKARVLALSKVRRELAVETLGAFKTVGGDKVDHGNKLQLPDYPAFIAAADKALGAGNA